MWLITHAGGTIGQAVTRAAAERGHALRLLVCDPTVTHWVPAGAEVVCPDIFDEAASARLLDGIEALVLVSPLRPELVEWHAGLAKAARKKGVKRVVQITAQGSDAKSPMRIFRWLGEAEARVKAAGIEAHVLRPALCMQILLKQSNDICGCGVIEAPMRAARWPMVDARDVGEVAVKLLEDPRARPAVHELTGPQELDYFEIARIVSRGLGRKVEYLDVCAPKARGRLEARRLQPRLIDGLLEFWDYAASGLVEWRTTDAVQSILGRPPRRLVDFVKDEMQEVVQLKAHA
jgi:NAD(P)H dehydrogenase (quinone)